MDVIYAVCILLLCLGVFFMTLVALVTVLQDVYEHHTHNRKDS
jgi:hypothetical protein